MSVSARALRPGAGGRAQHAHAAGQGDARVWGLTAAGARDGTARAAGGRASYRCAPTSCGSAARRVRADHGPAPGLGPIAGIHAALRVAPGRRLAGDRLRPALPRRSDARAPDGAPRPELRGNGLPQQYRRPARAAVRDLRAPRRASLEDWIAQDSAARAHSSSRRCAAARPAEPRALDNINTPAEYAAAQRALAPCALSAAPAASATLRCCASRRAAQEELDTPAGTPQELYEELRAPARTHARRAVLRVAINDEFADWRAPLARRAIRWCSCRRWPADEPLPPAGIRRSSRSGCGARCSTDRVAAASWPSKAGCAITTKAARCTGSSTRPSQRWRCARASASSMRRASASRRARRCARTASARWRSASSPCGSGSARRTATRRSRPAATSSMRSSTGVPIWKKEYYADGDSGWVNCEALRARPRTCAAAARIAHDMHG